MNKKTETKITANTFIPISFIIAILAAALWVGDIKSTADAALKGAESCKTEYTFIQDKVLSHMINVENRLSKIEGYLQKFKYNQLS